MMQISKETLDHLTGMVCYPATGEQIKRAGNMMAAITSVERQICIEKINSLKTYRSAGDVIADLQAHSAPSANLYAGHPGPYVRFSLARLAS
jgi:hypothetical protein